MRLHSVLHWSNALAAGLLLTALAPAAARPSPAPSDLLVIGSETSKKGTTEGAISLRRGEGPPLFVGASGPFDLFGHAPFVSFDEVPFSAGTDTTCSCPDPKDPYNPDWGPLTCGNKYIGVFGTVTVRPGQPFFGLIGYAGSYDEETFRRDVMGDYQVIVDGVAVMGDLIGVAHVKLGDILSGTLTDGTVMNLTQAIWEPGLHQLVYRNRRAFPICQTGDWAGQWEWRVTVLVAGPRWR